MFCPSCGKQIPDGSMTCPICGANLAGAPQGAAPGPQPGPAPQPAPGPMPQAGPGPAPQPGPQPGPYGPGAPAYNPMAAFKSSSLFSNVGNKLCTFALWLFWVGLGVSAFNCIVSIVGSAQAAGLGGLFGGGAAAGTVVMGVISALITMALQALIFLVASLAAYAIGDMARKKGI